MSHDVRIQYDTASLETQLPAIRESRFAAHKRLVDESAFRLAGLRVESPHELWMFAYRRCTLRQAIAQILGRIEDDSALAVHLQTLLKLNRHPPLTRKDFNSAEGLTARLMVTGWILDRGHPDLLKSSLCFHSDRAMAKTLYFLSNRDGLKRSGGVAPKDLARLSQKEPERVRKLYLKLGLVRAEPATIKDVSWRDGAIHFEVFKAAIFRG